MDLNEQVVFFRFVFGCFGCILLCFCNLELWFIFSTFVASLFYCCYMEERLLYRRCVLGIDPGLSGGISVLGMDGVLLDVVVMPSTMQDLLDYLRRWVVGDYVPVCYMESVGYGLPGQSSSATAKFARHNGHIEMALLSLGIKTNMVTPQKWMKSYQLGRSSDYSKTEWKNRLKSKAQQLFPSLGGLVTLKVCDSLLIAEYGRKQELGI